MPLEKKDNKKQILVCDCEGTMKLDPKALAKGLGGEVKVNTQLCRAQIDNFEAALAAGTPVLVACTQEAPLFAERAAQTYPGAALTYTNIRERAGWSKQGPRAMPKILALLAEAGLDQPMTPTVSLESEGEVLVWGRDSDAIDAAGRLAGRMAVTCLLAPGTQVPPPLVSEFTLLGGAIAGLQGHLGGFSVSIEGLTQASPSARGVTDFTGAGQQMSAKFDIILDLTGGAPLVSAPEKRDGYFNPDPGNPALLERALFDITNLTGTFEKPRYVKYDAGLCVHSRNAKTGCSRCLDICPAGAIEPAGDVVAIDPYICGGCGSCASVCPTGASSYDLPSENFLYKRLATLLDTYREHGGGKPVLLVHDTAHGAAMIAAMARSGDGLPAACLPFAVNEVTQVGLDFLSAALAYGAGAVVLLADPRRSAELDGLKTQIELAASLMAGLGYKGERIHLIDEADPDAVSAALYGLKAPAPPAAGSFLVMGGKRSTIGLALQHLHKEAPRPVDTLALPAGAPFGAIEIDTKGCTMCLSCVGACPAGALVADEDSPRLSFIEAACVQCGLCRVTCPEKVIALTPRYNFLPAARTPEVKNEEEPFKCPGCGEPFGIKSSIEKMIEQLKDHSMFRDAAALDRLRLCPDCRVEALATAGDPAFGGAPRPAPRTTADYLREAAEAEAGAPKPPGKGNGKG
ncbi:MAG: 4Fe-4S dicluster domain-containing protein [Alphaproteobacteria bacterium]